jgi:hypothetical protein
MSNVHRLVLEGLFGPVYKATTTSELIASKQLADFKIKCLILKYPENVCQASKKWDYQTEMNYLVLNEQRNKFIKNLTLSLEGNTLLLFQYVEKHGKKLYESIKEVAKNRHVFFVFGGTDVEVRESVRTITDSHPVKNEILFEFGKNKVKCRYDDLVILSDATTKKAKFITENDDIDDSWILNNKSK